MTPTLRPIQPTFLRLEGRIGWQMRPASRDIFYDDIAGGLRLGDENATAILPTEPAGTFGGLTKPTGLAAGPDSRLFLADPGGNRILTYTTHQAAFLPLWTPAPLPESLQPCFIELAAPEAAPPDPYTLRQPRSLAFSREGDLVAADTGHSRVIIYTWPGLVARQIISLPGGEPWDLAYDAAGHLYVADAVARRIHRFDRLWRPELSYEGGAGLLQKPRHLAFDQAGLLFVLDESLRQVIALDERGRAIPETDPRLVALPLHRRSFSPPLRLDGAGLWLPQEERPDCPALLLPGLEVDRRGRLKGTGLTLLARPAGVRYPRNGVYLSEPLDSDIFNCAWHRLALDLVIPDNTSLTIRTFTAPAALDATRIDNLPLERWSTPLTIGPQDWPELLVQSPAGRYLWLRIDFNSNGEATPLLKAMTLYAPRQSSLAYLPPVFHEDPVSANFLERFLSYFDTVFQEMESQIEQFNAYLDPDSVPAGDFLNWLAGWLDITFLAEWPDQTRRDFIRQAINLYKQRGTIAGLQAILRLHTGLLPPQPIIIEHFRLRDYGSRYEAGLAGLVNSQLYLAGQPLEPLPADLAHHFTVLLPNQVAPTSEALATLVRLIEAQKPAHTRYELRLVMPDLRIGCQSTIGVDMLIGAYPAAPLAELRLGQSSQLASARPQLGYSHLRL